MRHPYWRDATATLYAADTREILADMPTGSVECVVTSPPPWTPEDQQQASRPDDHRPAPDLYVADLRRILAEIHRVLVGDGTLWLHLSDRHAPQHTRGPMTSGKHARRLRGRPHTGHEGPSTDPSAKSLMGLPWQIAFALQDDGWIIRNAIVWHQPQGLPDAAQPFADRLAFTYELIFLLVKQQHYWFDLDPIRQALRRPEVAADPPMVGRRQGAAGCRGASARRPGEQGQRHRIGRCSGAVGHCCGRLRSRSMVPAGRRHAATPPTGTDPGDVWTIAAPLDRLIPFAAMPVGIPLR